jgi:hypothetical protein
LGLVVKDQTQALNIPFTLTQGDLLQEALAVTFVKDQTKALNIPFTLTHVQCFGLVFDERYC